jgi:hypothetical protein
VKDIIQRTVHFSLANFNQEISNEWQQVSKVCGKTNLVTQEAQIRRTAVRANSSQEPISKNPSQKIGWWNGTR